MRLFGSFAVPHSCSFNLRSQVRVKTIHLPHIQNFTTTRVFMETNSTRKPLSLRLPKKNDHHVKIEFEESATHNLPELIEEKQEQKETKQENTTQISPSEPPKWKEMWAKIAEMRKSRTAPVDEMGCDTHSDPAADPKVQRFQLLVALMLSSQTRDMMTDRAMKALVSHGLTIDNILKTPVPKLHEMIRCVNFYTRKTDYLKRTCEILRDKYDYDVPSTYEDIIALPGVGPKMTHLLLQCAWNKTEGIAVDVHVHRVANRIGWVRNTKTPEHTRKALQQWVPQEEWGNINGLLIGFGQTVCLPRGPKCEECLAKDMCPSAAGFLNAKNAKLKAKKKKKEPSSSPDENTKKKSKVLKTLSKATRKKYNLPSDSESDATFNQKMKYPPRNQENLCNIIHT